MFSYAHTHSGDISGLTDPHEDYIDRAKGREERQTCQWIYGIGECGEVV